MMRNRTLAAWALLWATLVSSGAAQDAVIEDDAPVLVGDEADDAPLLTENRPSWFDEVNAPIDHPLAPELCWQGPDWLRPFCAYPRAGYRASIDVVILSRATPSDVPLLRDVTTSAELLNADDMTFNPEIGPRFTFVAPLTDRWDL